MAGNALVPDPPRAEGTGLPWDVPVAEVSSLESTQRARADYEQAGSSQTTYLGGGGRIAESAHK